MPNKLCITFTFHLTILESAIQLVLETLELSHYDKKKIPCIIDHANLLYFGIVSFTCNVII